MLDRGNKDLIVLICSDKDDFCKTVHTISCLSFFENKGTIHTVSYSHVFVINIYIF